MLDLKYLVRINAYFACLFLPIRLILSIHLIVGLAAFGYVDIAVAAINHTANAKRIASVNNIRIWRDKEYTRIVFDLDSAVKYSVSQTSNPHRIYVNISNASINVALERLPLSKTPVNIIRTATINNDLRLTLELKQKVSAKSFFLKKEGASDDRLVLDLYDTVDTTPSNPTLSSNDLKEPTSIEALVASEPEPKADELKKPKVNLNGRDILITVDAGHGGQDTGALGSNGLREKDITLAIAKELIAEINAQPGFSAHGTRTTDIFIPLKERRDIARDKKADLFISIHADAFTNSLAKGASVFALSRKGATSETARFLAQHENESDAIGGIAGVSLDDKDAVLAGVLVDLSMTATVNSSLLVGNQVLKSLGTFASLHAKHVEQAGFVVLKSPDVPSILIETGFISNKEESRQLASPAYRAKIAQSIVKGLRRYFIQHPPAGSVLAQPLQDTKPDRDSKKNIGEKRHVVVRGDTLSNIAVRYRIKQSVLAKYNGLPFNASIKIGQTLKIPAQ